MNSDADKFFEEIASKYRTYHRLCPMTTEEAEAAFDNAPEIPMTAEEIARIVEKVKCDVIGQAVRTGKLRPMGEWSGQ